LRLLIGVRGEGSGKVSGAVLREWCERVGIREKTCRPWLDVEANAVPSTRNLATMAENSPELSLDWLLLGREPDFYKSQPLPRSRLASEIRGYIIGRLLQAGPWTATDLDRWIAPGDEILEVLVRLNDERATYHAVYEKAHGGAAPADLTPSSSTIGQMPMDMTRDLLALLRKQPPTPESKPFYEPFIRR
jgi:hypothetical protein